MSAPALPTRRESSGWGWQVLRWSYARWIQIVAHADLIGSDKRPSQSKLASFAVVNVGLVCALWQVTHGADVSGTVMTIVIAGLCASFGRTVLTAFLQRGTFTLSRSESDTRAATLSETRSDTRTHHITETIERKIVADPDGDYEVTK
jgi:hypothetical protein